MNRKQIKLIDAPANVLLERVGMGIEIPMYFIKDDIAGMVAAIYTDSYDIRIYTLRVFEHDLVIVRDDLSIGVDKKEKT